MAKPQPEQNQLPVVARLRIRYAKRGPMRFTSHRDFARAFERAVRRAALPVAYSQGFTPHPKISYASAAPTGTASEAEYLEIALHAEVDPEQARAALDAALSPGLDVLDVRPVPPRSGEQAASAGASLADRLEVSRWLVELPGVPTVRLAAAVDAFLAQDEVVVQRMTKQGRRRFDARAAVLSLTVAPLTATPARTGAVPDTAVSQECAMMEVVVRQVAPAVRPDDVLAGLRVVAGLEPPVPPRVTRLAQGRVTPHGEIADPFEDDPSTAGTS